MEWGWNQSLNRLKQQVENGEITMTNGNKNSTLSVLSDREVSLSRVFNAPRELVFKAHMDPKMVAQWWGQKESTTIVDKLEAKPGGAWRFVQRAPSGEEYGFKGEFREVVPPERFTWTFEFEGMPGHVIVETMTFEDLNGKTKLTATSVFDSIEDRDGMLQTGMEEGAIESWNRLEELLQTQKA
jgi:uncharacterized protein YndB with AHSA1/START domain